MRLPAAVLLLPVLLPALLPGSARAARPFTTDDARVVDRGGCQIESFVKQQQRQKESEFWFLPACNPSGLELTVGGQFNDNAASASSRVTYLQGKTLLRALEPNGTGFALTLGAQLQRPAAAGADERWSPYLNGIASRSFADDRVVMHMNLGVTADRPMERSRANWGLGAEILLTPKLYGIVETYGTEPERPNRQVGLRWWLVPNRFQVDATAGEQRAGEASKRWLSVGVRALF